MMGGVEFELRLRWAVDRLTRETVQRVVDDSGEAVYLRAAPLLQELRTEVRPSGEKSSGGSSAGPGAPVALDLLVLLSSIEEEVARAYWRVREATRRPGFGGYTLEERLTYAAARAIDLGLAEELCQEFVRWPSQIERAFDPPKVVPLTDHACPICRHGRTSVQIEPGEFVEQPALMVTFGERTVARCGECGASWVGDQMLDLAASIGGDTQVMQHVLGNVAGRPVS